MGLHLKSTARVYGLKPEILLAVIVANDVYKEHGAHLTITAGMDGKHMHGSKHYSGMAIDLRIWNIREKREIARQIGDRLGGDYDVVLEADHIHIEYHPKKLYADI